jgi:TATA-box binding protein (TBP) (component of TFIID and TFIIIB)
MEAGSVLYTEGVLIVVGAGVVDNLVAVRRIVITRLRMGSLNLTTECHVHSTNPVANHRASD